MLKNSRRNIRYDIEVSNEMLHLMKVKSGNNFHSKPKKVKSRFEFIALSTGFLSISRNPSVRAELALKQCQ